MAEALAKLALELNGHSPAASTGMQPTTPSRIERQIKSKTELLFYAFMLIVFDVGKLITSYSLKYFNNDVYPVEQTLIIFLTEDVKLIIMIGYLVRSGSMREVSLSLKFAVPSVLYAINNNLYLYAFHFTTPAVWNILTQSRIIITALIYRLVFKKHITTIQWLSLGVLALAISITQLPSSGGGTGTLSADGLAHGGHQLVQPVAVLIATLCSLISVTAGIYVEYSFKNDKRNFGDQQLQLCLFAALASLLLYRVEAHASRTKVQSTASLVQDSDGINWLMVLLAVCVLLSAVSGLVTGVVIKKLDNIVKIYSQSLCGIVNGIVCMFAFPSKFSPDWHYFVSLLLVVASIVVYERSGTYGGDGSFKSGGLRTGHRCPPTPTTPATSEGLPASPTPADTSSWLSELRTLK